MNPKLRLCSRVFPAPSEGFEPCAEFRGSFDNHLLGSVSPGKLEHLGGMVPTTTLGVFVSGPIALTRAFHGPHVSCGDVTTWGDPVVLLFM